MESHSEKKNRIYKELNGNGKTESTVTKMKLFNRSNRKNRQKQNKTEAYRSVQLVKKI